MTGSSVGFGDFVDRWVGALEMAAEISVWSLEKLAEDLGGMEELFVILLVVEEKVVRSKFFAARMGLGLLLKDVSTPSEQRNHARK